MMESERQIQATEDEATALTLLGASQRSGETEVLLSQLRDLRMGRPPKVRVLEQRAALERIEAALDAYRSFFYPAGPHQ